MQRDTDGQLVLPIGEENGSQFDRPVSRGFDIVLGNPPYSTVQKRKDVPGKALAYPPFVRMMWELVDTEYSSSGMVLPLSIAYHSGRPLSALREEMRSVKGSWRAAFFDRTPDSLFSDDVKTRNAILFLEAGPAEKATIATTGFLRWSSRGRGSLFTGLRYTEVGWDGVHRSLPKLGSETERAVYAALRSIGKTLRSDVAKAAQDERIEPEAGEPVYFGGTAYNWLTVYRSLTPDLAQSIDARAAQSLWEFKCPSAAYADCLFATASSRLAYWLWRVESDGFHLPRAFIESLPLPLSDLTPQLHAELGSMGRNLWLQLQAEPVFSVNKGVRSVSYSPHSCGPLIDEIDLLLLQALALPVDFAQELRRFEHYTVIAGRDAEIPTNPALRRFSNRRANG